MPKTIALFDFDDVINVFPNNKKVHLKRSGWDADAWYKTSHLTGGYDFPVNYNTEMIAAINALPSSGVDVAWLTTWAHNDDAPAPGFYSTDQFPAEKAADKAFLASLGFSEFDAMDAPGTFGEFYGATASKWWKYQAIQWIMDNTDYTKIVVADDKLTRNTGKVALREHGKVVGVKFVGITPFGTIGLTKKDFSLFSA